MFADAVIALIGEYEPVTYDVCTYIMDESTFASSPDGAEYSFYASANEYSTSTDTYTATGLAGVDWPWVCSLVLVTTLLFCFCRMIGGMLRG